MCSSKRNGSLQEAYSNIWEDLMRSIQSLVLEE